MASTSTIKSNCYNFLNSNLRTIIDNKFERNTSTSSSVSFDEFAETRSRSTRAASLVAPSHSLLDQLEQEQAAANSVNLKPTPLTTSIKNTITNTVSSSLSKLRRHSTSASYDQDDDLVEEQAKKNRVFVTNGESEANGVLPLSNENLKLHRKMSRKWRSGKAVASSTGSSSSTNLAYPPVPRRKFPGGSTARQGSRDTPSITQTRQKSYSVDQQPDCPSNQMLGNSSNDGKFSSLSSISGREDEVDQLGMSENDDRMSIESSVFEDAAPYNSALLARQQMSCDYDEQSSALLTKKMLSSSNRSSSDSNKSQITIDTGYMSSTTSTINTESPADRVPPGMGNGPFRSRFSSEDTQSSLDSFMSSSEPQMIQHQQRYITDYSSSYGTANPSPSYLQTGGTSSHYLAAGSNDVIEYLQKYSARNYPNNQRTPTTTITGNKSATTNSGRQRDQTNTHHHQPQQQQQTPPQQQGQSSTQQQINGCSFSKTGGAVVTGSSNSQLMLSSGSNSSRTGGNTSDSGSSNSTSATNSMASLSPTVVTSGTTSMFNNKNSSSISGNSNSSSSNTTSNKQQPTSLAKLTPPPSTSSTTTTSSASHSVSLSGTGVTTITATTTISTETQPRNSSASFGHKSLASIAIPLRTQVSFDSAKIIQTGQILGAKITQHFTGNRQQQQPQQQQQQPAPSPQDKSMSGARGEGPPQTGVSVINPAPPRRGLNGILNKPPPLTQIHQTKMNRRQDSNISSDSFSITSSPGYNSKSMEAPLLQHTSKIHRSVGAMKHQDSSDSFSMTMRGPSSGVCGNPRKFNVRQDSTISSDSFSQTSSPGYNSKLMEAPLLAHAAKMHKSE